MSIRKEFNDFKKELAEIIKFQQTHPDFDL
jgi:hypothetical protein